ncbi:hypothetical protein [Burkholderia sp. MSMB0265]|uniref:hypothetical protein n=1 Tax=unclassified Burkholderia TaxID=2613784 RepID=UPI003FA4A67F
MSRETLRKWVNQAECDRGERPRRNTRPSRRKCDSESDRRSRACARRTSGCPARQSPRSRQGT